MRCWKIQNRTDGQRAIRFRTRHKTTAVAAENNMQHGKCIPSRHNAQLNAVRIGGMSYLISCLKESASTSTLAILSHTSFSRS
jgi:hypothetical protein